MDEATETPVRVVAAVLRRGNRVMVCQRPLHKRHGGLWEFPGGKLEPDESIPSAVQRELAEELAVEVVSVGSLLFSTQDPGSHFLIEFYPVEIRGEPVPIEHTAIAWMTEEELMTIALAPSDKRFALHLTGSTSSTT